MMMCSLLLPSLLSFYLSIYLFILSLTTLSRLLVFNCINCATICLARPIDDAKCRLIGKDADAGKD